MTTINLGRGLNVDARVLATEVTALLGMRGKGKSNLAAVAVEGLLRAKIPVVVTATRVRVEPTAADATISGTNGAMPAAARRLLQAVP